MTHLRRILSFVLALALLASSGNSIPPGLSQTSPSTVSASSLSIKNLSSWASSASWVWSTQNPFNISAGTTYPTTGLGYIVVTGGTNVYTGAYLVDGKAGAFATGGVDGTQNMLHTQQNIFTSAGATGGFGYWVPNAVAKRVFIFDGNSLVAGTGASSARMSFPEQCVRLAGIPWIFGGNFGVGGQTTPEMTADAATQIDALMTDATKVYVIVPWEITNDLFYGSNHATPASPTTAVANMVTYCDGRLAYASAHGMTCYIVMPEVLPRNNGDANFESYRATVNTALNSGTNLGVHWHRTAKIAQDPRLGISTQVSDTRYFSDGVHLTDEGYGIVGFYVMLEANSLF